LRLGCRGGRGSRSRGKNERLQRWHPGCRRRGGCRGCRWRWRRRELCGRRRWKRRRRWPELPIGCRRCRRCRRQRGHGRLVPLRRYRSSPAERLLGERRRGRRRSGRWWRCSEDAGRGRGRGHRGPRLCVLRGRRRGSRGSRGSSGDLTGECGARQRLVVPRRGPARIELCHDSRSFRGAVPRSSHTL
jgi:hypothetical protein